MHRKANWLEHIPRRNCFLHDLIEGQMTEGEGIGRRSTQLNDDLRIKEEDEDRTSLKQFTTRT